MSKTNCEQFFYTMQQVQHAFKHSYNPENVENRGWFSSDV